MEFILVIDFGSQYNQLIVRKIRELSVYSELIPFNSPSLLDTAKSDLCRGIVLSGGPASVYEKNAPVVSKEIFQLGKPILGICYGMQLGCFLMGLDVRSASKSNGETTKEYGFTECFIRNNQSLIVNNIPREFIVWMSHQDYVTTNQKCSLKIIATTRNNVPAIVEQPKANFYGLQFHPEVAHTQHGKKILYNFIFKICKIKNRWTPSAQKTEILNKLTNEIKDNKVICGTSGGIDSTLVAVLLKLAIGKNLIPVFVDTGLLRIGDREFVVNNLVKKLGINVKFIDRRSLFLNALKNVVDPERKRKIVGKLFIDVFKEVSLKNGNIKYLAQGTLYPDVIESVSATGAPSDKIKSHHNVGGLPKKHGFHLIEPLRYLFKDEVRKLAKELGVPDEIINAQPFPGPGLSIRIIGSVDETKLKTLRLADAIVRREIERNGLHKGLWQYFAVYLPVKTVGIMGDQRSYGNTIAVRIVRSTDAMTANWAYIPHRVLQAISNSIINEVEGINRVVYDISSKPPATIEWE